MKLTQANIDRFKLPAGKSEHIEFDEAMPGFGLRVRKGDKREHRTFIAQYKIATQNRRITLGNVAKVTLDDARKEARKAFAKVALGHDPANEKTAARKAAAETLGALIEKYLASAKTSQRARTYEASEHHLNTLFAPLHRQAVTAISRATVAAQVRAIGMTNGPVAANRARASLSAMFRWAIAEGDIDQNPVVGTNKQEENGPRERSLSDAELAAVWIAAPDNDYGRIVQLLILTGCRRTEIGDLQWPEIDLEGRTITLPASRTKNGQPHTVPLSNAAATIIEGVTRRDGRDYVFGSGKGGYSGWSKAKAALDDAAKLEDEWTLHDLRRTVRTGFGRLGIQPHIAEAALNHLPPKLIRTYDRNTYADEIKDALDKWAGHIKVALANAEGANVTSLRKA
jgi:integrase